MLSQEEITLELLSDFLEPIAPMLADDSITDIFVNAGGREVSCERFGRLEQTDIRLDIVDLRRILQQIARPLGEEINEERPLLNARLNGLRINAILPPISHNGVCIAIRKFMGDRYTLSDLIAREMLSAELADLLSRELLNRETILLSGATGSGKTTLLTCLTKAIPETERVLLLQDTAEIQYARRELIALETRPERKEYGDRPIPAIGMRDLVKQSLRFRPDRLIIGEVRGAEAWDLLQALNTGHGGSMSTIHANSALDALHRLTDLAMEANVGLPQTSLQMRVARAIRYVAHVERIAGKRQVTEVVRVNGLFRDCSEFDCTPITFQQEAA